MANCSAGPRCRISCPGGCGCVYVYEEDACTCECFDGESTSSGLQLGLGSKINVSVDGLPLAQVAAQFDRLLMHDVLLPAARLKELVHLSLEKVTFSAALKSLGLSTRKPLIPTPPKSPKRSGST
jgi:hypothetical protein